MPGLLTDLFDYDDGASTAENQSYSAQADGGMDLSPTVSVSHDAEGSYQGLDGSTNEWSSDTDIVLTTDITTGLIGTAAVADSSDYPGQ